MQLADDINYYPEAPPTFGYIMIKAANFLNLGPEQYRKADFFNLPAKGLEGQALGFVRSGFSQILDGRGYTTDRPIQGIGVAAIYDMIEILHFEMVSRLSKPSGHGFLDMMDCRHRVTPGTTISLYNSVVHELFKS